MIDINKALESHNIAKDLEEKELEEIGDFVHEGYELDLTSRKDWEENLDKWTKLALQVSEQKNFPWPKSANVKYPLLSTAAMQFAARAYPALVPSNGDVVQARVIGREERGAKTQKATKIAKHMSWQLMYQMHDWEEEMDKLLVILPVVGTVFKKTYFDSVKGHNVSRLVLPKDLVVNYWAKSLEEAERKTEVIEMSARVLKERQLDGIYLDVELPEPALPEGQKPKDNGIVMPAKADQTTPYRILEQHCFYDLDDDGYPEPYIITIEQTSKKVLRIVARFDQKGIKLGQEGKISRIDPIEYYTKFPFIPNPDGGFYDIGFGLLLGSINETINTSINQLLDSGTLKNLPSGFISKNMRLRQGEQRIGPGEWRSVNATGEQMKNGILPLPVNDPSKTTFDLMIALVESGDKLASIAEIFVGKMPGQNTPATTTMASVDQGMKLFTAVYKRIFKALEKEYKKLFRLNSIYLDEQEAMMVLDEQITKEEYNQEDYDVCPGADPSAFSSTQKLVKAQALMELLPLGTVDPLKTTARILEAQEQPNWEELVVTQMPKDPEMAKMEAEMQMKQQEHQMKMKLEEMKIQFKKAELEMELKFKQQELRLKAVEAKLDIQVSQAETQNDMQLQSMEHQQNLQMQKEQHEMDKEIGATEHKQNMQMTQEKHEMQKKQMKEKAAMKPAAGSKSGDSKKPKK